MQRLCSSSTPRSWAIVLPPLMQYVCVRADLSIHGHTDTQTHRHTQTQVYTNTCTHARTKTCECECVCHNTNTQCRFRRSLSASGVCACVCACVRVCVCACVRARARARVRACVRPIERANHGKSARGQRPSSTSAKIVYIERGRATERQWEGGGWWGERCTQTQSAQRPRPEYELTASA